MKFFVPILDYIATTPSTNLLQKKLEEGMSGNFYEISGDIRQADFVLLPNLWNYYINHNEIKAAKKIAGETIQAGKRLIIFSNGDYTANTPFTNSVEIQYSSFKSRDGVNGKKLLGMPNFIDDYLLTYCNNILQIREKKAQPVVGFCGQASGSTIDYIRRRLQIYIKKIGFKFGYFKWEPPNIEPTYFRNRILRQVQQTYGISSNMVFRTRYRAGYRPKIKDPFHPTRLEFINNILDSDYTICIRGGGNFSVRFYETLALGRIPIFINTDCVLPLDEIIEYKKFMVWVEEDEIPILGEKILSFHNSLSNKQFIDLQRECRNIWKKNLTEKGFFESLPSVLERLI